MGYDMESLRRQFQARMAEPAALQQAIHAALSAFAGRLEEALAEKAFVVEASVPVTLQMPEGAVGAIEGLSGAVDRLASAIDGKEVVVRVQLPAPVVEVTVPAPVVNVAPAQVTVEGPVIPPQAAPEVTVEVAPAQVTVTPEIVVEAPSKDRKVTFDTDRQGRITGATIEDEED